MYEHDKDFIDDFAFIKSKMDDLNNMEIPASIYSQSLLHLLNDVEQIEQTEQIEQNTTKPKLSLWKRPLAYAAMFAIIFGVYYASGMNRPQNMPENTPAPMMANLPDSRSRAATGGTSFYAQDYTQIRQAAGDAYQNIADKQAADLRENGKGGGGGLDGSAAAAGIEEAAPMAPTPAQDLVDNKANTGNVSSTNVQVAGIDEADIVKTDGENLYVYRTNQEGKNEIAIVEAASLEKVSAIPLENSPSLVPEIYLEGERLVVLNPEAERTVPMKPEVVSMTLETATKPMFEQYNKKSASGAGIFSRAVPPPNRINYDMQSSKNSIASAIIFDVSDSKNPKEVRRFEQDGSYTSSRLHDGILYLVTTKVITDDPRDDKGLLPALVPVTGDSVIGQAAPITADCIAIFPEYESTQYAVVSAFEIANDTSPAVTKAVLGSAEQVYMTAQSLYLTATDYTKTSVYDTSNTPKTNLLKFSIDGTAIELVAQSQVNGYIDNQFSMDEYDNHFRIATTSYADNGNGGTENNLYVLNQYLQPVGSITGLAKGERIYSVRYMGDMAYVVTFRQVDPLFAIDLSDPANPKVLGQLKIPGFSEYLHPIDENTLIGFGVNTKELPSGTVREDGLKLSLFDVSDPLNPKERNTFYLGNAGSHSEVLVTHKAFLYDKNRSMIGFPVTVNSDITAGTSEDEWARQYKTTFDGYMLMKVDANKGFETLATIPSSSEDPAHSNSAERITRSVYIGDHLYTISNNKLMEYSLSSFEKLREVRL